MSDYGGDDYGGNDAGYEYVRLQKMHYWSASLSHSMAIIQKYMAVG
jgi:hypothetical protein